MIKKISAVLLALTLCFSVMVLPATALSGEEKIGYRIELDKDTYAAGDDVIVSLYLDVDDATEIHTGSLLFGLNTDAFDVTTTNAPANIKATAVGNDTWSSFYNDPSSLNWAVLVDKVATQVQGSNTAAENELYDKYIKVVVTRNTSASHANAGDNKHGLPGSDINADTAPFLQFTLKLKDDLADGTAVNVGITSGSIAKTQTAFKYLTNPGNAISTANIPAEQTNLDNSADTATIGAAGPKVDYYKAQIKMTPDSATTVKDDFQFRVQSVITDADWDAYFAQTATADETKNAITEMGIVAYKGAGTFDEATAKALVTDGTAATDYATAGTTYVQKASDSADAYFGAIIKAKHTTMVNDVTYMGYVKYVDAAGNAQVIFYETAKTAALASNYDNFVSAYLAANPYQG